MLNAYTVIPHLHKKGSTPNEPNLCGLEKMKWNHGILRPKHLNRDEHRSKDDESNSKSNDKTNVPLHRVQILEHLDKNDEARG